MGGTAQGELNRIIQRAFGVTSGSARNPVWENAFGVDKLGWFGFRPKKSARQSRMEKDAWPEKRPLASSHVSKDEFRHADEHAEVGRPLAPIPETTGSRRARADRHPSCNLE